MKYKQSSRKSPLNILAVLVLIMTTSAPAFTSQWGPEEMRGKVTSVAANRIQIEMGQKEWLPRAGTVLKLGAEMAGMFVPLKGSFVIIQVNADNVIGQAVGAETHGTPAAGMLAIIQTPYPNHPQRRADYMAATDSTRQPLSTVLPMAQGGDPNAQHLLAMSYEQIGDHDYALSGGKKQIGEATNPR